MGMKEESDEVTTKTRLLSLELLQVNSSSSKSIHVLGLSNTFTKLERVELKESKRPTFPIMFRHVYSRNIIFFSSEY